MSKNLSKEEEQINENNSSTQSTHFLRRKRKEENSLATYIPIQKSLSSWCNSEVKISNLNESFKDGREIKEFEYEKLLKKSYNDEKITNFFKSKKNSLRGSPNFASPGGAAGSNPVEENSEKNNPQIISQHNNINNPTSKINFFDSPFKCASKIKNNLSSPLNTKNNTPLSNKKKRLEKDIKEYFKQFKLSSRTLMTLHKGKFISDVKNSEEIIKSKNIMPMMKSSPTHLTKIVKNLPVQSPKKNEKNLKEIDKILNSISMKERFEELLKRELILPCIYKILLLQFKTLDRLILYLKFEKKIPSSLDSINSVLCSKKHKLKLDDSTLFNKEILKMPISQDDFSKMLTVAPYIFVYSLLKGKLLVEIPNDTEKRIKVYFNLIIRLN
jgi:hypothetical protein